MASTAGLELQAFKEWHEFEAVFSVELNPVVFMDAGTEKELSDRTNQLSEKYGLYSQKIDTNQFHLLSGLDLPEAKYILACPLFGNFINRNYGVVEDSGTRYGNILKATLGGKPFGLSTLLSSTAKVQKVVFKSTAQKQEGVEAVRNLLLATQFKARMSTVVANAVDELLMNAMFDACTDERGRQQYAATPRNTVMVLEGKQAVELQVGFDKGFVGVTAVDHFGSLDKTRLVEHLSKGYQTEEYRVKTSVAGAGIGLATVFRSGGSFLFSCEAGHQTEVSVFFQKADSFKQFRDQFRFICTQFFFESTPR